MPSGGSRCKRIWYYHTIWENGFTPPQYDLQAKPLAASGWKMVWIKSPWDLICSLYSEQWNKNTESYIEHLCVFDQGGSEKSKISSISTNTAGLCVKKPWNPQRIPAALCLTSCLCLRNIRHFLCFQIPLKVYTRKPLNKRYVAAAADVYHFILGKHRTIPALRLKHRSGGCGTASALPKCSIRHPVLSALLA